ITDFHYILQIAMGWSDDHLNQFKIHGKRYGIARIGGISFSDDPDSVRLKDLGLRINERFIYEYDFTDGWQHQIRVESILAPEPQKRYPICIAGRRACPPEDCGGPLRFMALRQHYCLYHIMDRLLEIVEDGGSQEHHQAELETLHYWLHINRFDRKGTNRRLYDYARGQNVFAWE
ncbi:MAG: plasmid pRiA4b ORF-3 family protein, partial [Desulfobacteraceae bacterium]|nr:plasmid pRiA4b ORF-3 family protein [Desulfobacteraceae bacterium]